MEQKCAIWMSSNTATQLYQTWSMSSPFHALLSEMDLGLIPAYSDVLEGSYKVMYSMATNRTPALETSPLIEGGSSLCALHDA